MAGDVTVAVVSAALSISDGDTTDFTKTDFGTPKACMIIVGADANDGDGAVDSQSRVSIGFSDFTDDYCIAHQDETVQAKVDCDAIKSNTKSYIGLSSSGSVTFSGTASN